MGKDKKLEFYRSMLPYGTMKIVAQKASLTGQSVANYLNGLNGSVRIENSILEVIAELQAERNNLSKNAGLI